MLQALRPSTPQALELVLLPNADLKAPLDSSKIDSGDAFASSIASVKLTTPPRDRPDLPGPDAPGSGHVRFRAFFQRRFVAGGFSPGPAAVGVLVRFPRGAGLVEDDLR